MRGLRLYFAKMPDEAIVEFMKALAIDPFHAPRPASGTAWPISTKGSMTMRGWSSRDS